MGVLGQNGMMWVYFRNDILQFLHPTLQPFIFGSRSPQDGVEIPVGLIEVVIGCGESLQTVAILLDHHTLHGLQVVQEGQLRTPSLFYLTATPLIISLITHPNHHPDT